MKKTVSQSLAIGLAMFSMFFGAGNIIFPLAVGQYAGEKNLYAMLGLTLTAAVMPIAGVIAMILFDGNYRQFFGRLGRWPGFVLALIIISLLGPLGSTPRCIALAYTTIKGSLLEVSPGVFSACACGIIFLFTIRKNHILSLLGWVLTPGLLISLLAIIAMGFMNEHELTPQTGSAMNLFFYGLKEGYNTMDLLAAFFFSSTILHILKMRLQTSEPSADYIQTAFQASFIGAFLLSAIYVGFSYLAAFHGAHLDTLGKDELLSAITLRVAGDYAGTLVCITIALACLTTAIALICAFTDFVQKEVFKEKVGYEIILVASLFVTFFVSTFEFTGISTFLGPILQISYPGLIVLTFLNIANRLTGFQTVKGPVFCTFVFSALLFML
jgi:LIVCS family branched-chain amino acid:cation transporter